MTSMKKVLLLAAVAVGVLSGSADTLYWQVGDSGYTGTDAAYASLFAKTDSGTVTLIDGAYDFTGDEGTGPFASDLGESTGATYSFFVELYNSSLDTVFVGESANYDTLVSSGYVSTSGISTPTYATSSWAAVRTGSVPEPTSGVLLLVGAGMLALRRRRRA